MGAPLLLLGALLTALPAAAGADVEARLTEVRGSVYLQTEERGEDEFVPAEAGAPLAPGDLLRTGSDGWAELVLDGDSLVEVGPDSEFLVEDLGSSTQRFRLAVGSLVAKVKSLLPGRSLSFQTSSAVAAVRGTELAVEQEEPGSETVVGVFDEGAVFLSQPGGEGEVRVGPGEEAESHPARGLSKAGALRRLQARRERVARARANLAVRRARWKAMSPEERRRFRERLGTLKALRLEQLRKVRKDRLQLHRELRRGALERRGERRERLREGLQERREELREKARERLEDRRGKAKDRREKAEEERDERRPRRRP